MKLLILAVALVMSVAAFASEKKHMVEFSNVSSLIGTLSFTKSKDQFSSGETKSALLYVNYAYSVADHVQIGTQVSYYNFDYGGSNSEGYALLLGGIYNLDSDFRKSFYASVYGGYSWTTGTENLISRASVGKRIPLSMLDLENVTYSPEVSFTSQNPTKSSGTEWTQDLSFKFLQFSIFF